MKELLVRFDSDMTERLSCRNGDVLAWFRWQDPFYSPAIRLEDFWFLQDGDQVIITNRLPDVPNWFSLAPQELTGPAYSMREMLGGPIETEPMDGPNIWRVSSVDTLVWIGEPRRGVPAKQGVLKVFQLLTRCLVLGEPKEFSAMSIPFTLEPGAAAYKELPGRLRVAQEMAQEAGAPRVLPGSPVWTFPMR